MDNQERQLPFQGMMLFFGLSLGLAIGNKYLSQMKSLVWRHDKMLALVTAWLGEGEGEHIGGIIDSPIASIELANSVVVSNDQPELHWRT